MTWAVEDRVKYGGLADLSFLILLAFELFAMVLCTRIKTYALMDAWFTFNLRIQNRVSHKHSYSLLYILHQHDSIIHNSFLYIHELPSDGSTTNESSLAIFSKQSETFHSPHGTGHLAASHR